MSEYLDGLAQSSFVQIIVQSGTLSMAILILLLLMSIVSWTVIGWKWFALKAAMGNASKFLKHLDLTAGLSDIVSRSETFSMTYFAKEFKAAYKEYQYSIRLAKKSYNLGSRQDILARVERGIERCIVDENLRYENSLIILATISSSAPFIGLFGTVTGIIDAFYSIGNQGSASIAVVAPGISAALVATAFGLFAAIPALVTYNFFRNKTRIIRQEMDRFGFELINLFDKEYSKSALVIQKISKANKPTKVP